MLTCDRCRYVEECARLSGSQVVQPVARYYTILYDIVQYCEYCSISYNIGQLCYWGSEGNRSRRGKGGYMRQEIGVTRSEWISIEWSVRECPAEVDGLKKEWLVVECS
ncbi:hypothetical protein AVEN_259822-1 [Araneus ventricosus]|uniref:Uncharacterized protein n=1 Tax=Araneus ventricosus TaxID=182803 RepID=A0A4Y2I5Y5_ARAVE|nr:hypothetical protein AVEN_259822-1 [Araneus ventricosus]